MTSQSAPGPSSTAPTSVDPRGLRFSAALTSVVLAVALVVPTPVATVLVTLQAVVFALGAFVGLSSSPYGWIFRVAVRPRLAPPAELEDARPPRFAQLVGLVFAAVALVGFLSGATILGLVAAALALVAALLNATVGLCLGCELYLLGRRLRPAGAAS